MPQNKQRLSCKRKFVWKWWNDVKCWVDQISVLMQDAERHWGRPNVYDYLADMSVWELDSHSQAHLGESTAPDIKSYCIVIYFLTWLYCCISRFAFDRDKLRKLEFGLWTLDLCLWTLDFFYGLRMRGSYWVTFTLWVLLLEASFMLKSYGWVGGGP